MKESSSSLFILIFGIVLVILSIFVRTIIIRWGDIALIEILSVLGVILIIVGLFGILKKKGPQEEELSKEKEEEK